jgi:hypothetical protein
MNSQILPPGSTFVPFDRGFSKIDTNVVEDIPTVYNDDYLGGKGNETKFDALKIR